MKKTKTLFLLYYSQSFGHARIALSLAENILPYSECKLVNGGAPLNGISIPKGVNVENLEALTAESGIYDGAIPLNPKLSLEEALNKREERFKDIIDGFNPDVLIVDFFPFGRMFLKEEFIRFITLVKEINPRCRIVSSTREIIAKDDSEEGKLEKHTRRINKILAEYFDQVWIHADPQICPSFDISLNEENVEKIHYTGYLPPLNWKKRNKGAKKYDVLAMAGGGSIADETLYYALNVCKRMNLKAIFVTGPFFDEKKRTSIRESIIGTNIELITSSENILELIDSSEIIFSMAGYGSISDLLYSNAKALLIPKRLDDEQLLRAEGLSHYKNFELVAAHSDIDMVIKSWMKLREIDVASDKIVDDNYLINFLASFYHSIVEIR